MTAREIAYIALLASLRNEHFIVHTLAQWQKNEHPPMLDFAFAYEIASGAGRMALALDYIGAQLSTAKKLSLKLKEKALLRTAIYQYCFMSKVPLYAIANESTEIAKKYCHPTFASFLNALLRKLEDGIPQLPQGSSPQELSIRLSYPRYFVGQLIVDYGKETAEEILTLGNTAPKTMARVRPGVNINTKAMEFLTPIKEAGIPVAVIQKASEMSTISAMPEFYIQNATSAALIADLAEKTAKPKRLLDLCASPGGKLLAAHDLYPESELFANDLTEEKIVRLSQNLTKYGVKAQLSCGPGEDYQSDVRFDVIILDVPCSNSGVLNKRAEARWRLSPEAITTLLAKQRALIVHAKSLLAPGGVIWYLTCSILKSENEEMIASVTSQGDLHAVFSKTILPNSNGWDGGFGCLLKPEPSFK